MQSFLLLELKEKTLGTEQPGVFLFIKARQLAVKFPPRRLPMTGSFRLKRKGKNQLLLKQRCQFQRGTPCMAVQAMN